MTGASQLQQEVATRVEEEGMYGADCKGGRRFKRNGLVIGVHHFQIALACKCQQLRIHAKGTAYHKSVGGD